MDTLFKDLRYGIRNLLKHPLSLWSRSAPSTKVDPLQALRYE